MGFLSEYGPYLNVSLFGNSSLGQVVCEVPQVFRERISGSMDGEERMMAGVCENILV